MHAIIVEDYGSPEVMQWREVPRPVPGPGDVLVQLIASGVNYMDTGVRTTPTPGWNFPGGIGVEGVGRVVETGPGAEEFTPGQRVAWFYHPGSYAEYLAVPATSLVPVPDGVGDDTAAGLLMQGLTANHFTTETYDVRPGDTALVHAAAGGVGQLLAQLIRARGGHVIGIVSRPEKEEAARAAGAEHVLVHSGGGFEGRVRELTDGQGVHVAYDGAGSETFRSSLASLRVHGTLAYYGPYMGVPTLKTTDLQNSILLTAPKVGDHVRTPEALRRRGAELFDHVLAGRLKVTVGARYPLREAARAHMDLESRRTQGKLLLVP
ncbi:quinone oxidoreductase family protein [Streptomyces sp. NPDC091272]|uniref:quinone oxidoreductase family protein n=1 Tax=Streptomyces sp. NPDC091272 TaxID=3365981 RepID=UPI003827ECB6